MSPVWIRPAAAVALSLALCSTLAPVAYAQGGPGNQPFRGTMEAVQGDANRRVVVMPAELNRRNAEELRNDFREVMRQYPPALGEVLKLDPSLMMNATYLQTYPALASFLSAHPQVPRYPDFFLDFVHTAQDRQPPAEYTPQRAQMDMMRNMVDSLSIGAVIGLFALTLTWLVRHLLAHRRWLRATKLQMEIHNKLMERLSSTGDVQAYLESASTNKLLTDVPLMAETASKIGAPLGRILWSVQAGIVLAAAGIGLLIIRRYLPEADEVLILPGVLAIAIGLGFALAAAASYILSNRLGLLDSSAAPRNGQDRA